MLVFELTDLVFDISDIAFCCIDVFFQFSYFGIRTVNLFSIIPGHGAFFTAFVVVSGKTRMMKIRFCLF